VQTNLPLNADRLWADLMALAEITDAVHPKRCGSRRLLAAPQHGK
jgi:hypothetical protein